MERNSRVIPVYREPIANLSAFLANPPEWYTYHDGRFWCKEGKIMFCVVFVI